MKEQGVEIVEAVGGTGTLFQAAGLRAELIAPSFERGERLFARYGGLCAAAGKAAFPAEARSLAYALNDFSLALMIEYQGTKIFLPGDATADSLGADEGFRRTLAAGDLRAEVLKLAHHGQRDSVNEAFIRAVSPQVIVTCSSSDRRYESAHPDVYARIEQWLGRKPEYLFSDCPDIAANILCRTPHQAALVTIGENSEGEIRCYCE
jgi:competence protein ComEC